MFMRRIGLPPALDKPKGLSYDATMWGSGGTHKSPAYSLCILIVMSPKGPFRLVTVNTAPERAKRLIGRVAEALSDRYTIIHVDNCESMYSAICLKSNRKLIHV